MAQFEIYPKVLSISRDFQIYETDP